MVRVAKIMVVLGFLVLCRSAWAVDANDPNLIAHWKFDEGSGTIAYDSAGSNNGTLNGDANWTAGQIDGALSFDGDGDYVAVNGVEIHKEAAYSIIIWVKGAAQADNRVYSEGSSSNNDPLLNIGSHHISTSKARFIVRDDNGIIRLNAESIATAFDNTWHQIAWVDNSGTYATYIDGVADVSGSYTKNSKTLDRTTIGAFGRIAYSSFFDGTIDDVRIYNRALSAEEVQQLYYEGFSEYERAIIIMEDVLAEKEESLDASLVLIAKEWLAYDALEELLASGDYGELNKGDIVTAKQKIHSAIQHQEQSLDTLEKSIEKLYDALAALGWEPEPEFNLPEP